MSPPLNYEIPGFPDGVQVVEIESRGAALARDLALHLSDLTFSKNVLDLLPANPSPDDIGQMASWRCAIYQFYKCFQHSESRVNLESSKVLIGASVPVRENFKYYKNLRNKHLIHDENSNSQVSVIAVLNDGSKPHKIEGVRAITLRFDDFGAQAVVNFKSVVNWTIDFVRREFDPLMEKIRTDLELKPLKDLQRLTAPQHVVPGVADVSKPRPKK
ncbi:MAG: hypothetical protein ACYDBZ_16510 [Steroidobacteraceae bacterium]